MARIIRRRHASAAPPPGHSDGPRAAAVDPPATAKGREGHPARGAASRGSGGGDETARRLLRHHRATAHHRPAGLGLIGCWPDGAGRRCAIHRPLPYRPLTSPSPHPCHLLVHPPRHARSPSQHAAARCSSFVLPSHTFASCSHLRQHRRQLCNPVPLLWVTRLRIYRLHTRARTLARVRCSERREPLRRRARR